MKEPPVSFYMQDYTTPDRTLDIIPGHWRNDPDFPVPGATTLTFYLEDEGRLSSVASQRPNRAYDEYEYLATVGLSNGYCKGENWFEKN